MRNRKVRNYRLVAATADEGPRGSAHAVPRQKRAAVVVARLARELMALYEEITETDALVESRFRDHPHVGSS